MKTTADEMMMMVMHLYDGYCNEKNKDMQLRSEYIGAWGSIRCIWW